jgi:hypothetical protein
MNFGWILLPIGHNAKPGVVSHLPRIMRWITEVGFIYLILLKTSMAIFDRLVTLKIRKAPTKDTSATL